MAGRERGAHSRWLGRGGTRVALAIAGIALAFGARDAAAQGGRVSAQECCLTLVFPIGARALALGDAIGARGDATALFANPSALAGAISDEFYVHTASSSFDRSNTFSLVIRSDVAGSFGVSYWLLDHGDQTATDPSGNPIGTLGTVEQVLTLTYGSAVTAGLSAGVNYKLYQLRQDCRGFCGIEPFAATTHGIDAGLQLERGPVALGLAVTHLGFPLQVINAEQASPLPTRYRVSGALEILSLVRPDSTAELWLSADLIGSARDLGEAPVSHFGAELTLQDAIFLWAGWAGGTGLFSGGSVGVGLRYERFDIAVAKSFVATIGNDAEPFQVTFGVRF